MNIPNKYICNLINYKSKFYIKHAINNNDNYRNNMWNVWWNYWSK